MAFRSGERGSILNIITPISPNAFHASFEFCRGQPPIRIRLEFGSMLFSKAAGIASSFICSIFCDFIAFLQCSHNTTPLLQEIPTMRLTLMDPALLLFAVHPSFKPSFFFCFLRHSDEDGACSYSRGLISNLNPLASKYIAT